MQTDGTPTAVAIFSSRFLDSVPSGWRRLIQPPRLSNAIRRGALQHEIPDGIKPGDIDFFGKW
jgi:hypothetical protein